MSRQELVEFVKNKGFQETDFTVDDVQDFLNEIGMNLVCVEDDYFVELLY